MTHASALLPWIAAKTHPNILSRRKKEQKESYVRQNSCKTISIYSQEGKLLLLTWYIFVGHRWYIRHHVLSGKAKSNANLFWARPGKNQPDFRSPRVSNIIHWDRKSHYPKASNQMWGENIFRLSVLPKVAHKGKCSKYKLSTFGVVGLLASRWQGQRLASWKGGGSTSSSPGEPRRHLWQGACLQQVVRSSLARWLQAALKPQE